jgi:hypothetical protein
MRDSPAGNSRWPDLNEMLAPAAWPGFQAGGQRRSTFLV